MAAAPGCKFLLWEQNGTGWKEKLMSAGKSHTKVIHFRQQATFRREFIMYWNACCCWVFFQCLKLPFSKKDDRHSEYRVCLASGLFVKATPVCMKTSGMAKSWQCQSTRSGAKKWQTPPRGKHFSFMFILCLLLSALGFICFFFIYLTLLQRNTEV